MSYVHEHHDDRTPEEVRLHAHKVQFAVIVGLIALLFLCRLVWKACYGTPPPANSATSAN